MWSTWSSPSGWWVMNRTERSWVACSRSAVSARRVGGSRWAVGSSRSSSAGSARNARASASRCRSPPETAAPWVPTGVSQPRDRDLIHGSSRARATAPSSSSSVASGRASRTLSRMVASNRCGSCGHPPMTDRTSSAA